MIVSCCQHHDDFIVDASVHHIFSINAAKQAASVI
jgi:hypothetical protein